MSKQNLQHNTTTDPPSKSYLNFNDLKSVLPPTPNFTDSTFYSGKNKQTVFSPTICHGVVKEEDFEKMVPSQWWKTVFADDLYLKTDGDVVEDPEITREEIRMLETNSNIKSLFDTGVTSEANQGAKILDLCCGQGRHSLFLAEKYPALRLFGHDQSPYLISLARDRALNLPPAINRSSPPIFTVGDCRAVPYESEEFDFAMIMGNSFGYFSANDAGNDDAGHHSSEETQLDDNGDRAVLKEINRVLKVGGRMILDLVDGDYMRENYSPRSWEWIDHQTFVCRERTLSRDKKRLHSREVVVSVTRGVLRDQFYSERLYSRAELKSLLQDSGFDIELDDASDKETVTTAKELSQRGQDLGMMEQRLLIHSIKIKTHPSIPRAKSNVSETAHPFLSRENAQAVREWLDRLSPELFTRKNHHSAHFSPDYIDLVNRWLHQVKQKLKAIGLLDSVDVETDGLSDILRPAFYHLLPPPPFPGAQLAVILGDTSIPCREKLNGVWNHEDLETRRELIKALLDSGYNANQIHIIENHRQLVQYFSAQTPVFTFNLCDEGFLNDAHKELHVPSLLEMCNFPYSGAGPVSLGVCYDKGFVNSTACSLGVPTPRETYIILPECVEIKEIRLDDIEKIVREKERNGQIEYPSFVKPMKGDNSLGITGRSIVHNRTDLTTYIEYLIQTYGIREFILQEYLCGTEYSVGMIGNPETGFHFLPILQVDFSKVLNEGLEPILGWESKWDPESPYWTDIDYIVSPRIPSKKDFMKTKNIIGGLTIEEEEHLKKQCEILFERFGCRDYARFDWRADRDFQWDSKSNEYNGSKAAAQPASVHKEKSSISSQRELNIIKGASDVYCEDKSDSMGSESAERLTDSSSFDSSGRREDAGGLSDSGRGSSKSSESPGTERSVEDVSAVSNIDNGRSFRQIKLLEVNPNPGWCWDGKFAKMAAFEKKSYSDLIKSILWASWQRLYGSQLYSESQCVKKSSNI